MYLETEELQKADVIPLYFVPYIFQIQGSHFSFLSNMKSPVAFDLRKGSFF